MKLKEDNINIYNNSAIILNRKAPFFLNSWITILIILLILIIIASFIPFNIYKTYSGYVILDNNNNSYINLLTQKSDFPIKKNNILYIRDYNYKYKVISIEESNVLLSINLKDDIKINNNLVVVNVLNKTTTLFKEIKNKIKKGLGL